MLVIIVGGIPIAMPTVLSVTLALGAFKLAKEGAIVARMSAVEEMAGQPFCTSMVVIVAHLLGYHLYHVNMCLSLVQFSCTCGCMHAICMQPMHMFDCVCLLVQYKLCSWTGNILEHAWEALCKQLLVSALHVTSSPTSVVCVCRHGHPMFRQDRNLDSEQAHC